MDFDFYTDKLKRLHDQHTHIFQLATELKNKAVASEYYNVFSLGDVLQREVRQHFLEEESAMLDFGFPYTGHHKREHTKLSSLLMRSVLAAEYKEEEMAEKVDMFLQALTYHIEVHDAAYTNFLTKKIKGEKR